MKSLCASGTYSRYLRRCLVFLVCAFCLAGFGRIAEAQSASDIVRVEEDWELVIGTPDPGTDAPQVTCVLSPVGNVDSIYAAFAVNHQSLPDYLPGGLQLQVWDNELPQLSRKFPNCAVMAAVGETVSWTQSMALENGLLVFETIGGSSVTWGNFGGQGYLKTNVNTPLANLNGYSPTVSVEHSGISYAANRVQSLVLRRVRLFTFGGDMQEATVSLTVYQQQ